MAETHDDPPPPPGGILFHTGDIAYEFIRDLGVGARGERRVLARPRERKGLGRQVVIKVLSRLDDPRLRQRLEEDSRLAMKLSHPNVARVYGLHEERGVLYAIQEHVEGRCLDEVYEDALLCRRWCSEPFVLYVAAEVASALHHAHTLTDDAGQPLGLVHRDIHPLSILLRPRGEVKLTDFGLTTSGRQLTTIPRMRGHVLYASPEQLLGRPVEARADLFSVGLVMLELLTGQHLFWLMEDVDLRKLVEDAASMSPAGRQVMDALIDEMGRLHGAAWTGEDRAQLLARANSFGAHEIERIARDVPEPTRLILRKLLQREPAERYPSAKELEGALRGRLRELGGYGAREAAEEVFALQCLVKGISMEDLAIPPKGRARETVTERDEDKIPTAPAHGDAGAR
jgi:serine/threonine-protein kinase